MTLHNIEGANKPRKLRSAPGAISIITGRKYDDVVDAVLARTGWSHMGAQQVPSYVVRDVLKQFGWKMEQVKVEAGLHEQVLARLDGCRKPRPPSLAEWLRLRAPEQMKETFLVYTNHYLVVRGRKAADFATRVSVFTSKLYWRRARVHHVWRLVNVAAIAAAERAEQQQAEVKRERTKRIRAATLTKARAMKFAKAMDLVLEAENGTIAFSNGAVYRDWQSALDGLRSIRDAGQ